jgi:methanogenic corrinoid protein MtbC1
MDEMRQCLEGFGYDGHGSEISELCPSDFDGDIRSLVRDMRWGDELASIVEAEIIPRLMIAHRPEFGAGGGNISPGPGFSLGPEAIAAFCALMLSPAGEVVEARITALIGAGLTLESLLLDLLAPTARHLGVLWEEDLCDFAEVTVAMGRLQRVMHSITRRFGGEPLRHRHGRSILLMPCPGEVHGFGLSVVEQLFRDAGWDVTSTACDPTDDPLHRIRTTWFDVIGVSLASEALLPSLVHAVAALKRHSQNPGVRVMVGGAVFVANPDFYTSVGADATAGDARQATSIAEGLLDLPARPC